jgi:LmbE family N-acetylglucosaminyl deacetylase
MSKPSGVLQTDFKTRSHRIRMFGHMNRSTQPRTGVSTATAYTIAGNTLMAIERELPRRLLGVWAHPDDEAYLSAGLMARVIADGGTVTILTATRGEKGTDDPALYDSDEFGALRESELVAALAVLGVTDVRFLGLRDGECDGADDERAIDQILQAIEDVLPDAIVTFGPDGITNHPDHRAVSRWTTEAWRRAGRGELLYATMTHDYIALHRDLHDRVGVFGEFPGGRPVSVGRSGVALECSLTRVELDRKRRALAAHATQTTPLAALIGEETYRTWWRDERFRAPRPAEISRFEISAWMQPTAGLPRALLDAAS